MGLVRNIFYIIAGAATGYVSHGHLRPELLALTAFVPLVWSFTMYRAEAGLFVFMYYLLAARGIPAGGAVFFGPDTPLFFSGLLWLASAVALSAPWIILWTKRHYSFFSAFLRLLFIFIFISIPPIGLFGWASPLLAVGILMPGSGWAGLLMYMIGISVLATIKNKYHLTIFAVAATIVIFTATHHQTSSPRPEGFSGIDTHYGRVASGSARYTEAFIRTSDIVVRVLSEDAAYVVVPETVAGIWTKASEDFWSGLVSLLKERKQTLIVGAEIYDVAKKYDNCMLFLGFDENKFYRQRVPVPVSMWLPFGGAGTANAYWFDPGVVELVDGRRAAMLICYEQFIVWPTLCSFATAPDMLVTTANQWWCRNTSIPKIQLQCAASWAKLFGVPLITATNR